jgi:hypothetical protein
MTLTETHQQPLSKSEAASRPHPVDAAKFKTGRKTVAGNAEEDRSLLAQVDMLKSLTTHIAID